MNMNDPLSKDDQDQEQQNNYSFDGKPGSYDSNSNSAQHKKSFSTTKPTEYNLPKKQPESTSNNLEALETKAKNILLPWRKKHNKDSEGSGTNTDTNVLPNANMDHNTNVSSDVNPTIAPRTHSHSKSISSPNIKTTPPTTYGTANANSSPNVKTTSSTHAHAHSKTATTPTTTHGHANVNTGPTATAATHEHSHAKTTPPTHGHAHDSTGPAATAAVTAATAAMQEHSHAKTTPPIHGQAHDSTGPNAATTTTHGYAHIKTTYPASPGSSNVGTGPNATATTHGHAYVKTTYPTTQGHANATISPSTSISTNQKRSNVNASPSATKEYSNVNPIIKPASNVSSNVNSSLNRDAIPGGYPSTSSKANTNANSGVNSVDPNDPSIYIGTTSPTGGNNSKKSYSSNTGTPHDTIKEIAEKVKMNKSEQTGLKNDQISGSDPILGQTMDPKNIKKGTAGVAMGSGLSSQQPSYNDNMMNVQYPEKTKAEKQNISENAAEKFKNERDDILNKGDDYEPQIITSKSNSNWGPVDYNTDNGKNKNLQDVVVPSAMKDNSLGGTSAKSDTKHGSMEHTSSGNLRDVVGSQSAGRNTQVPKNSTQNVVLPPAMKDEDLNKDKPVSRKPDDYGLDYLDDVEDYDDHDDHGINDYSNVKDEDQYNMFAQHEEKPNYNRYQAAEHIPGAYKADTFSSSAQRQDADALSPKQKTYYASNESNVNPSQGKYEFSNMSGNAKPADFSKNTSGPTPTRFNLVDQIKPREAERAENVSSNAKDSEYTAPGNTKNTGVHSKGSDAGTFGSATNADANVRNTGVAAFDNNRTAGTTYAKSGDAVTAAYDNIKNTANRRVESENTDATAFVSTGREDTTHVKSRDADTAYAQENPLQQQTGYGSGHDATSHESSDDEIDVNKNQKVLNKEAPDYKRELDLENQRRSNIGGTDAAEVGNYPSLIDPDVPTYGFKDDNTPNPQKLSLSSSTEATGPEAANYSIHNEAISQGRKVSVGSVGSGKSKHHHHHHSRTNSSKSPDYDYNSNNSTDQAPRHHHHTHGTDEGEEQEYEGEEGEQHAGKQNFIGRVRKSISGGTFGFRSEI
ncbi:hypothetical protein SUVZ_04G0220 [Saccharomyces uvarum]|uniref:Hbt1p n=1 Tax=Saccharomyces uvarum TaxID=230603 RepID=A0ABN8WWI2_SACUV|nr:hypothetical protein SUVZ_04G0220 [Saccharomyces uvarum]